MTIATDVGHLRLEWATEQLRAGDDAVAHIAVAAGFADQANFTRWFRPATGWTLAAHRRMAR